MIKVTEYEVSRSFKLVGYEIRLSYHHTQNLKTKLNFEMDNINCFKPLWLHIGEESRRFQCALLPFLLSHNLHKRLRIPCKCEVG